MRRLAVAMLVLGALVLGGCGGSGSSTNGSSLPTKVIHVTFDGDSVTPSGERYDVALGQRIELEVTADKPGEIHVHSNPEQEFEYPQGTKTLKLTPITQPGLVTVESHTLDKVLFQLRVQ